MKKYLLIVIIFSFNFISYCELNNNQINKFANCIKLIENGNTINPKYPYGVRSIPYPNNCKLTKEQWARNITINSIVNNYHRWEKSGKTNDFRIFFASHWCPEKSDKIGFRNWTNNIIRMFPDKIN